MENPTVMIHNLSRSAFLLFLALAGVATSTGANESAEPSLSYSVKVGDKTVTVSEGETAQIEGTFTNPAVTVTPQSHRVFAFQGIRFKYPRSFTFEADLDDADSKNWTLSGTDLTIMYFVINGTVTTAEFAKSMTEQFGPGGTKILNQNATLTLGGKELSGISLEITIASHHMVMDVYQIPASGETTKLLVFQDSLDDAGKRSKEGERTLAEIASSFVLEK